MFRPRIIFFGTDEFSAPILHKLLDMDREKIIDLVGVVTKPDTYNHGHAVPPVVARVAREFNNEFNRSVPIFQSTSLATITVALAALEPDAGVLASFGKIIPNSTLALFATRYTRNDRQTIGAGIINFHPSLLPKLRGPSPIETTILNGDRETGLTLIRLAEQMDAGAILYQEKIALTGRETASQLRDQFSQRGAKIIRDKLVNLVENNPTGTTQTESDATFSHIIQKSYAVLDPTELTAAEADRHVRAFNIWPKARLNFAKTRAHLYANFPDQNIILTDTTPLKIAPGDGWPDVIEFANHTTLKINKIISPKSGKDMTMDEYLRGLK
ncbi:MAG: methionyl-tRNA formyltransferase [Candidatus Nanoperiomorbaceae bacterium]